MLQEVNSGGLTPPLTCYGIMGRASEWVGKQTERVRAGLGAALVRAILKGKAITPQEANTTHSEHHKGFSANTCSAGQAWGR